MAELGIAALVSHNIVGFVGDTLLAENVWDGTRRELGVADKADDVVRHERCDTEFRHALADMPRGRRGGSRRSGPPSPGSSSRRASDGARCGPPPRRRGWTGDRRIARGRDRSGHRVRSEGGTGRARGCRAGPGRRRGGRSASGHRRRVLARIRSISPCQNGIISATWASTSGGPHSASGASSKRAASGQGAPPTTPGRVDASRAEPSCNRWSRVSSLMVGSVARAA